MSTPTSAAATKFLYKEAMEQVHSYNSKLLLDRKLRMPYIDIQTGLAQQDCHLWVSRVQRCAPVREGQIYSYKARRWRVKKRPDFIGLSSKPDKTKANENEDSQESSQDEKGVAFEDSNVSYDSLSQQSAFDEYYEDEAFDSEFDSDEEFGKRSKKKRGRGSKNSKKKSLALKLAEKIKIISREDLSAMTLEEREKPYDCQICGKRYKNQQGLRYHYEHYNHDAEPPPQTPATQPTLTPVVAEPSPPVTTTAVTTLEAETISVSIEQPTPDHVSGAKRKKGSPPSAYCDFCLGDKQSNKKSGISEELISCADCGRSGHPSCLQFNDSLTTQVKKYKWQCIECKCCCLCGTSDNDDQLLFCDECDRGYHMYCLNPPISEPPEGSWQCQLCEARMKGTDVSNVSVLPDHMDVVES